MTATTTLTAAERAALDRFEAQFRAAIREPLRELVAALASRPQDPPAGRRS